MTDSAVLIVSPEPWDGLQVSKHHFARVLAAQGCPVLFLDPPRAGVKLRVSDTDVSGIRRVEDDAVARGLRFMPRPLRNYLESLWLKQLERTAGVSIHAVWLFDASRFYDLKFAAPRLTIYHQMDFDQQFQQLTACRTADVCLTVTNVVARQLGEVRTDVAVVSHGVDVNHMLTEACDISIFEPNRTHAVYVGNLAYRYLDATLLARVIAEHPAIKFHLVGSYTEDCPLFRMVGSAENVRWWGKVSASAIPSILNCADVCLLCYDYQTFPNDVTNSHKILEYLLSGNVVVATFTEDYVQHRDVLEMVPHGGEYCAVFREVVDHLSQFNAPEKRCLRELFAAKHSYEAKLREIESLCMQLAGKSLSRSFK